MKQQMTRKRIENLEKKLSRESALERLAGLGGAQYGDHKPLKHRPFAGLTLPK
jgi:hypothetical protein